MLHAVDQARSAESKSVVIVTGGPGSGKSVIALSVMGELAARGRTVVHATGSRAFTQTLRTVSGITKKRSASLFKYFNQFMDADGNGLDVLILDEAHRLQETSASRYTPAALRTGRPQVDELIAAARVPVFLLDQHQVVRPGEQGTLDYIRRHAQGLGLPVYEIALDAQFRCGCSESYVCWMVDLFGLDGGTPHPWQRRLLPARCGRQHVRVWTKGLNNGTVQPDIAALRPRCPDSEVHSRANLIQQARVCPLCPLACDHLARTRPSKVKTDLCRIVSEAAAQGRRSLWTHSRRNMRAIKESYSRFTQSVPIIVLS